LAGDGKTELTADLSGAALSLGRAIDGAAM
jgi:hypothetical protein